MSTYLFFIVGLALILTHEMDAVRCREWELFPLLSRLETKVGYLVFTGLHIPLYIVLFWRLFGTGELNSELIRGLDIFFVVHVFLHILMYRHPKNHFKSAFSWFIILGSGVAGLIDLVLIR